MVFYPADFTFVCPTELEDPANLYDVSLSCTMCPDLVVAAQRIAALNKTVTSEVYDLIHFPVLRDRYNVMSVPCLVVDGGKTVSFCKKNIRQLLDILT